MTKEKHILQNILQNTIQNVSLNVDKDHSNIMSMIDKLYI